MTQTENLIWKQNKRNNSIAEHAHKLYLKFKGLKSLKYEKHGFEKNAFKVLLYLT